MSQIDALLVLAAIGLPLTLCAGWWCGARFQREQTRIAVEELLTWAEQSAESGRPIRFTPTRAGQPFYGVQKYDPTVPWAELRTRVEALVPPERAVSDDPEDEYREAR